MKKLKLEMDALTVTSFTACERTEATRGTMHAHQGAASGLCLTGTETVTCPFVGTCIACPRQA